MRTPLKIFMLATLVLGAIVCAFYAANRGQASVNTCGERYLVIGSRGSDDDFGDDPTIDNYGNTAKGMGAPGNSFAVAFANHFPRGQVTYARNYYPAKGRLTSLLGAITHIRPLGAYYDSVAEGKADLLNLIDREIGECQNVKMILVGYSQGAQVTGDVYQNLSPAQLKHVAGVVLFGDPAFNPLDVAANQSHYNKDEHGVLGDRPLFKGGAKVFSYCHEHDPVCQWPLSNPACAHKTSVSCRALIAEALVYRSSKHTDYTKLGEPEAAAQKLFNLLAKPSPPKTGSPSNNSDTYIGKTFSGYRGRVTVSTRGVFHPGHLPPLPVSGRTRLDNCPFNEVSDGVVEVSFSVTNLTKGFATPISVMPIADGLAEGIMLYIDSGGCREGTSGELMVGSVRSLGYGQSFRGDYFVIVPNYFSPNHPKGDVALAKNACTSVNAFFGVLRTSSFQQLWPAERRYGLPLLAGGKGCRP